MSDDLSTRGIERQRRRMTSDLGEKSGVLGAYGSLEEAFAVEHGISEAGVAVFIAVLRLLRDLPRHERTDVIALVAKCHIEPALRKVAFDV